MVSVVSYGNQMYRCFLVICFLAIDNGVRLKAVTEPNSVESTEITEWAWTEPTDNDGKLRFSDTRIR